MKLIKKHSRIENVVFGKNCTIVEPVNLFNCVLKNNVFVGPFVEIQGDVIIDSFTRISSHSLICAKAQIGKNCFVGHGVMFANDLFKNNIRSGDKRIFLPIKIGDNVNIGSNATILPVSICSNVTIGAGAVVTKNIFESGSYAGNPAKLIRKY